MSGKLQFSKKTRLIFFLATLIRYHIWVNQKWLPTVAVCVLQIELYKQIYFTAIMKEIQLKQAIAVHVTSVLTMIITKVYYLLSRVNILKP